MLQRPGCGGSIQIPPGRISPSGLMGLLILWPTSRQKLMNGVLISCDRWKWLLKGSTGIHKPTLGSESMSNFATL
ncbi:hypothetical protein CEXT_448241 [Caerostris extrusa]|uniref:Uncharacterized protein n=1 Tax=Caerostris extrusa TaxID=172846 RepID=A0AAV4QWK2_CAEEX|nr:hypothetical protein CEXT_448241 [Caerostris extrusa]